MFQLMDDVIVLSDQSQIETPWRDLCVITVSQLTLQMTQMQRAPDVEEEHTVVGAKQRDSI